MLMSTLNFSKLSPDTYLWRNGNATSSSKKSEFALIAVQKSRFAATGALFSMLPFEKIDNGENGSSFVKLTETLVQIRLMVSLFKMLQGLD